MRNVRSCRFVNINLRYHHFNSNDATYLSVYIQFFMRKLVFLVAVLAILTGSNATPLQAMLYCGLPTKNGVTDLNKLATLINEDLIGKGINVKVFCD
jgi:hypothetical protein